MPDNILGTEFDSELIIGIVSAVGTESRVVIDLLKERLGLAGYRVVTIKVSQDVIPQLVAVDVPDDKHYERLSALMDAGNAARGLDGGNDAVLALGSATVIGSLRELEKDETSLPLFKTAFIVDSLKRSEEVETLRQIYPSGFVLLGIHAEVSRRREHLIGNYGISEQQAEALMQRDADEGKVKHGQRVNKTFHLADFFVSISASRDQLRSDIKRMVELWFGQPFITPTFDEHAMFLAFSAGLRSADLSRQVGAVVTRDSQILSTGANECPSPGGGLYWSARNSETGCIGDIELGRDYKRTDGDSNRAEQIRIIEGILEEAKAGEFGIDPAKLRELLDSSRIRDLTEFGRVVHAEMEALLSCARCGISTVGTTLYCTTFPCHNCAKHIVAAGLERVVYVEPYPKSKALEFHEDSITSGGNVAVQGKRVKFEPFVGIGPRRFFDLFSMHLGSTYSIVRKDNDTGKQSEWSIDKARLRIQMKPLSYLELEFEASKLFGCVKDKVETPPSVADQTGPGFAPTSTST